LDGTLSMESAQSGGFTATTASSLSSRTTGSPDQSDYRQALIAAETAFEVLRMELAAVERAWAEEHASLLKQLLKKDQAIWLLAQQQSAGACQQHSVVPGALARARADPEPALPAKPPRIGHRERPISVHGFDLRGNGAMVTTPPKGKRARPTYTVSKPAWESGAYKSKAAPLKPKPSWPLPPNKQQAVSHAKPAGAAKLPTGKKKPISPNTLKKLLAKPPVPKPPMPPSLALCA